VVIYNQMDFVYICRNGPNEELRYSIRSLYANTKVNSIWIVGGKPDWYRGKYIPVEQDQTKYLNAQNNLKTIINSNKIPDKFVLMNDDFYVIKPLTSIPVYHGGSLHDKAIKFKKHRPGLYARQLEQTVKLLKENGVQNPLDYAIHVPMTIHKENFEFAVSLGGSIRSVYGNMNRIGGHRLPVDDVKVHPARIGYPKRFDYKTNEFDLPFLSTSDATFKQVHRDFLGQFDKPSKLELIY